MDRMNTLIHLRCLTPECFVGIKDQGTYGMIFVIERNRLRIRKNRSPYPRKSAL